jgi:hypothetical protein
LNDIIDIVDDFNFTAKATDTYNPILPIHKPRGKGGVATLWRKDIDPHIEVLDEGSERIVVIQIHSVPRKTCLINSYMPSNDKDHYMETLDEVHEILEKYSPTHDCIWGGDLNASMIRAPPNQQDRLLRAFCEEHNLHADTSSHKSTFFHYNGSESQIDYILVERPLEFEPYNIYDMEAINVSTHTPVKATISQRLLTECKQNHTYAAKTSKPRVRWEKVDTETYNEQLDIKLRAFDRADGASLPTELALKRISDIMLSSAEDALPHRPRKMKARKKTWPADIINACKAAKEIFHQWKISGRRKNSTNFEMLRDAKKNVRRQQRQFEARKRVSKIESIIDAAEHDQKTFFSIIKTQRSVKSPVTPYITVDDVKFEGEDVLSGFATYFEKLAAPKTDPKYDQSYDKQTKLNTELLYQISHIEAERGISVTPQASLQDIKSAIDSLKNGKAPDKEGMSAEHLKRATNIARPLQDITNRIQKNRTIPNTFKCGLVTPILKKGKSMYNPDHYRRITVTTINSKILEKIIVPSIDEPMTHLQSHMQRGFTAGSSSSNAALLYTEALAEAADLKKPVYTAMLDASKAFDVVRHDNLLMALYNHGVEGAHWELMYDWYKGMNSEIKWSGMISRNIKEYMGLRQGGGLSAGQYKVYTNRNLLKQKEANLGLSIGTVYAGCPTCADDIALVHDNSVDLQTSLNISSTFANQERFQFSDTKSKILVHDHRSSSQKTELWSLNGKDLEIKDEQEHLGIKRKSNKLCTDLKTAEERIQTGRRTVYSMFGAGLCGLNGLNPTTSFKIWKIYITPRLIHNLDVTINPPTVLEKIESYQRQTIKHLQHFPPNASNAATYLLSGVLPLQAEIDKRILSTFGRIIRDRNSAEFNVINRQINLKGLGTNSWTAKVKTLTHKYQLPSVYTLIDNPPTKVPWKKEVRVAVVKYHTNNLKSEMMKQSSTRHINPDACSLVRAHPVWRYTGSNTREITRATVKAKLLIGSYNLEAKKVRFGKDDSGMCLLCSTEMETREHLLTQCAVLEETRAPYISQLRGLVYDRVEESLADLHCTQENLTRNILDPSHIASDDVFLSKAESITRRLCYALHNHRLINIQQLASNPPANKSSTTLMQLPTQQTNGVRLKKAEYHRTR